MTAVLLFEAIDTALAILNAIVAWIAVLAFLATVVLYTLILTGAWIRRGVRRRPSWRRGRLRARRYARATHKRPSRRTATWRHAQPRSYEEAA
ncbi:hypothetical protein [Streptomyces aureus]|uniref:hypothetical protein n=1 Tax=Streptomyces aureus TaxID=193461 RepID=UPI000568509F|nr:hypothetical protein [Streptomyces aureus]